MKALFFDPYLDTLGGGERYTLTAAKVLLDHGWQVVIAWNDASIIDSAHNRFGLDLSQSVVDSDLYRLFTQPTSILDKRRRLVPFNLVFFLSDGSLPLLFGKKNILHYQVPFRATNRSVFLNRLKLFTIDEIVVNSRFTKRVIDQTLGTSRSKVLYPPVDTTAFATHPTKDKLILSVGRFASPSHSKRQDVLIEAFRQLCHLTSTNWHLVLAGGLPALSADDQPLDQLRHQAQGLAIDFIINPPYSELIKLYNRASIYWHAAGFEVDETLNPEAVEHFGITTAEAMAAGAIPVVIAKGGQTEIVDLDSGYLCQTVDEIVANSKNLIDHPEILNAYSAQCRLRAQSFNHQAFVSKFLELLS